MKQALMASTSSFAHLLRGGAKKAEDDDDKDEKKKEAAAKKAKEDDDDDDDKKGAKAEDDDDKKKDAKKAKAEDDDDDDDKKKDKKKEDDDEDEDTSSRRRSRRARENDEETSASRRGEAIFACEAAGVRPDVAAHLAFRTDLSAYAAVTLLDLVVSGREARQAAAPPAAKRADLRERMAQEPEYDVGTEVEQPAQSKTDAFVAKMLVADKKRRGIA